MAYRTSWKVLNDELGGLECTRELIYGHTFFGCWTRLPWYVTDRVTAPNVLKLEILSVRQMWLRC